MSAKGKRKKKADASDDEGSGGDDSSTKSDKKLKKATPVSDASSLTGDQIKKELKGRGLDDRGSKTTLMARLQKAIAGNIFDPEKMDVAHLRGELEHRGLDTAGSKAELAHRLALEVNRVAGKDTTAFNPSLLTVAQLKDWLKARALECPKNETKQFYVDLVSKHLKEQEDEVKGFDVDNMSQDDIVAWLKQNKIDLPSDLSTKDKAFYQKLMKDNMSVDKDGIYLFSEDHVISQKRLFYGQRLVVVKSDISKCAANAVVHPTNGDIQLGGGVGKALHAVSGPKFHKAVKDYVKAHGKLDATQCCITEGHELAAKHVIHTYSPVYSADEDKQSRKDLHDSIHNILQCAEDNELYSVALPSIGSGINGYPADLAAETILKAISAYFREKTVLSTIKQIYFVLFDTAAVDVYKKQLVSLGS